MDIEFTSELDLHLRGIAASDNDVIEAMLVSSMDEPEIAAALAQHESTYGRINFLMRNRHGTPFEHNMFKFYTSCPIFVFREWHRHRVGWSYNEESGRYKQLDPKFYIPAPDRKLMQVGKPGAYEYVEGTSELYDMLVAGDKEVYCEAYGWYERKLAQGVAKEVARMNLPVSIYSSMYVTCNARSLMSFLSLRQAHTMEEARYPSTPMKEINIIADKMEDIFATAMPKTHMAFVKNGYVAP